MSDAEGYQALGEAEAAAADKKRRASWLTRMRLPLMILGPALILAGVAYFVLTGGKSESTEDSYVQIAKAPVAASVSGRVIDVLVKENQLVRKGEPLFRLDPRDFDAAEAQYAAQVAVSEGQVRALRATVGQEGARIAMAQAKVLQSQSQVAQANNVVTFTASEAVRQKALFEAGVGSRDQYDQAVHAADNAKTALTTAQSAVTAANAEVLAARQAEAGAIANLGGPMDRPVDGHPLVLAAKANLERARLTQSYGVVVAPTDGIVTKVDQLQPGAFINASQTVFWLMTGAPWVEANFKEDQLAKMKIGQPAIIKVDSYPDAKLAGHVESFSPGTGQAFSALPAQNATGNWVKVTQRLPVRIAFDKVPPEMAGRAGLSAHVKVDVTGPGKTPHKG